MLAANYYPGKPSAVLDIVQIVGGHRTPVISFNVKNKREGRAVAKTYAAQPWNF
jgi:hypothetical protein